MDKANSAAWVSLIIVLIILFSYINRDYGYKNGQVDALSGTAYYAFTDGKWAKLDQPINVTCSQKGE